LSGRELERIGVWRVRLHFVRARPSRKLKSQKQRGRPEGGLRETSAAIAAVVALRR
jgi:hypothetical protein